MLNIEMITSLCHMLKKFLILISNYLCSKGIYTLILKIFYIYFKVRYVVTKKK